MVDILKGLNTVLYRSYHTCSSLKKTNIKARSSSLTNSILSVGRFFLTPQKNVADVVFFTYGVNRLKKNGMSYNKFSDSIASLNSSLRYVNLEEGEVDLLCKRSPNVTNVNVAVVDFISRVLSRLLNIRSHQVNPENYSEYLSSFGNKNKSLFYLYRFFFKIFLKNTQPKVIFVTNWYGIRSMAIISIAHELNIVVVDIQHGLSAANNHRCYIDLASIDKKLLPSHFFCWSEKDADQINSQFLSDRAIEVGRVWRFLPKEEYELFLPTGKPIVLLICGLDLPSWFSQMSDTMSGKYRYLIRPHPTFGLSQKSKKILDRVGDVYLHKYGSLEDALEYADCCIGEWSAGLVEAHEYGIVTIAYGEEACNYFQDSNILTTDKFDLFINHINNHGNQDKIKKYNLNKCEDNITGFIDERVSEK